MAGSINKVILVGNLGADPEVRHTEGGQVIANVRLATNRVYKNRDGERVEETEWHRIVFFGKLAEIVEQYLKKGATIYAEGRLRTRQWTDKDGNEKYTTEIVGENMTMLGSRGTGSNGAQSKTENVASDNEVSEPNGDDLPF